MRPKRYPYSGKTRALTTAIVKAWEIEYKKILQDSEQSQRILQEQITALSERIALT